MKWLLKLLPIKVKIALYDALYKDIGDQGEEEDRELAHVNAYEISLLKSVGGTGKINKKTGLKGYFGGGGGGGPAPAPASSTTTGTQTTISREAPDIESRKLSLYDEALALSRTPVEVPAYQVAGPSPLQQQEIDLRAQDIQRKAMVDEAQIGIDEKKLQQTAKIAQDRIDSQEDIAQLRANVNLSKQNDNNVKRNGS